MLGGNRSGWSLSAETATKALTGIRPSSGHTVAKTHTARDSGGVSGFVRPAQIPLKPEPYLYLKITAGIRELYAVVRLMQGKFKGFFSLCHVTSVICL